MRAPHPHSSLMVFGPQALVFDIDAFRKCHDQLEQSPEHRWALTAITSLSTYWDSVSSQVPKLKSFRAEKQLRDFSDRLQSGQVSETLFPLPNVLLSPLVVATQLTQYVSYLKAVLPNLTADDNLPASMKSTVETLGLCTGQLSAFAVASSGSLRELWSHGGVAIRLAMLVGALVDSEEADLDTEALSRTFSISWTASHSDGGVQELLKGFPSAYISVFFDEKRATMTVSHKEAPELLDVLNMSGVRATDVGLRGRFHWPDHQDGLQQLISFCEANPEFQFPKAENMPFSSFSNDGGSYITSGKLHDIALRAILLDQSQWFKTFQVASQAETGNISVICFGPERCAPPTLARKLGNRLMYGFDLDLASHLLPAQLGSQIEILPDDRIAVIGMACYVPGAEDLEAYWDILSAGLSQHTEVPSERFSIETAWRELDPTRKWFGNFIQDYDTFDHSFFKKSPREMASTDPQQRLILQLAYQAVQQSGYFRLAHFDKHIACYMGVGNVDYEDNVACYPANAYSATGNLKSFLAGKISHYFGWTGPSLTVDTACSSSSVAIHHACRAIINGECSSAIAGGVNIITSPDWYHNLDGASFLSPTGQCKPFDVKADGYCRGEGAGVVFLKKLSAAVADEDQILGVIASTRVYQNRNCTAITVPNAESLSELFADVVRRAHLQPRDVSVVEAHGTGTPVGDPAEYDGIRRVFGGPTRSNVLSLTSVKGLIGHTECASGVVSLIKTLLMISERSIPPQSSFTSMNPSLNALPEDQIEISRSMKAWKAPFLAALVNNYGASGSNACMIVTERPNSDLASSLSRPVLDGKLPFWFSAFDESSLHAYIIKIRQFLQRKPAAEVADISNLSFQVFRQANHSLSHHLIFSAASYADLEQKLSACDRGDKKDIVVNRPTSRPVILCFGGQVSTFVGLDKALYNCTKVFKKHLDHCDTICRALGLESLYPSIFQKSPLEDTVKLHTALFASQYACAKAWIDCGIKVAALVGHSFGELTALCVSGMLSVRDAIRMISTRASLIKGSWGPEKGAMVAVEAKLDAVEDLVAKVEKTLGVGQGLSIACYNSPTSYTLAGTTKAVELAMALAAADTSFHGLKIKRLNVTNAFHSALADPLQSELQALGQSLTFQKADIKLEHATKDASTAGVDARFVAKHLRNAVFFSDAVQRLAKEHPSAIWLEAGSNSGVTTIVSRVLGTSTPATFQPIHVGSDESVQLLTEATVKLWKEGLDVSFWPYHSSQTGSFRPIMLPPYQFKKSRHWMELKKPQKTDSTIEPILLAEVPKGLTSFVERVDKLIRFRVNTASDRFQKMVSAHIMANTAAVTPGMFQLEIALDALTSLRPEFKESMQPELQGMRHSNPLVMDDSKQVWLEAEPADQDEFRWTWSLIATEVSGASIHHTTGTIAFFPVDDVRFKDEFERLKRFSSRKRGLRLLNDPEADDVLQGRNIYRAFERVIDYKELYRHVAKIAGRENESAGRVVKSCDADVILDTVLTDCFCQVAGIFINLMTDKTDLSTRGIFICDGIDQWIQTPRAASVDLMSDTWDVFALHQQDSEAHYTSDVFVFEARSGRLTEAILGISYQRVSIPSIQKVLSRFSPNGASPSARKTNTGAPDSPSIAVPAALPFQYTAPSLPISSNSTEKFGNNWELTRKIQKKPKQKEGPNIAHMTRQILCNLSGLGPDEIHDNSDLVEIGIDSLMGMELKRDIDRAFNCTLDTDLLMNLTDFNSLVVCIRKVLGEDSEGVDANEVKNQVSPVINGITSHDSNANGVNHSVQMNGVNGYATPPTTTNNGWVSSQIVLDVFRRTKEATDDFIANGQLGTYYNEVMPRSTTLCVAHIVNAFEELGCHIRSAAPGQKLERVPHLQRHKRFMDLIYDLLKDSGLIDLNGSEITRTAAPPPSKSVDVLLEELLRDEPIHAAEHKLTALTGSKFANCITGKEDAINIIFGTPEGREIVTDVYAKSPINSIWIQQVEYFMETLLNRLPKTGETVNILEMGAGTGGTTCKIVPLLARLDIPVRYTMTDLSSSLVAAGRKRFKQYPFMEFKVLDIESSKPDAKLLQSQHIILATNCVHATRNLSISTSNIHKLLRPDGFLLLLEMTEQVPWVDFIFGLLEGWWLFEDDRRHALSPAKYWENTLRSVGYGHVDWTEGHRPEANLQRLIIAHASSPRYDRTPMCPSPAAPAHVALTDIIERQTAIDAYVKEYTQWFTEKFASQSSPANNFLLSQADPGKCVLVTGASGSLGSHLVAHLTRLPEIDKVICLNRVGTIDPVIRQLDSFKLRSLEFDPGQLSKLNIIETDTTKSFLGLDKALYENLSKTVTHIVHNAWPMSLTRTVKAYEGQFRVMRNLIHLAGEATCHHSSPFKFSFQFISSIGVVGYYPIATGGDPLAPEDRTNAKTVLPVGYADAKLVCEHMLDETLHQYAARFRPMSVRIAQIAGSTEDGYWNPVEHFPSMIKSSQTLNCLPDLQGTLSWCPVGDVADTLVDLLVSNVTPYPVYHIENPSRQPWPSMIDTIGEALNIPRDNILPFEQWLDMVRKFDGPSKDNPAGQLIEFFRDHFVRMSCGGLVLDTKKSCSHSKTLRNRGPVEKKQVVGYINAWKKMGLLR